MNFIEYIFNIFAFQIAIMVFSIPILIAIILLGALFEYAGIPELRYVIGALIATYVCSLFWLIHKSAKLRVYEGYSFMQSISVAVTEFKSIVMYSIDSFKFWVRQKF